VKHVTVRPSTEYFKKHRHQVLQKKKGTQSTYKINYLRNRIPSTGNKSTPVQKIINYQHLFSHLLVGLGGGVREQRGGVSVEHAGQRGQGGGGGPYGHQPLQQQAARPAHGHTLRVSYHQNIRQASKQQGRKRQLGGGGMRRTKHGAQCMENGKRTAAATELITPIKPINNNGAATGSTSKQHLHVTLVE
jgi:hypothetical protein